MSLVIATTDLMESAAQSLAGIRSSLAEAAGTAAGPTTGIAAAAQDEVSIAIAAMFGNVGQEFQTLSARAQTFHQQFVSLMNAGAGAYASAEAANAAQTALGGGVESGVLASVGQSLGGAVSGSEAAFGQFVGNVGSGLNGLARWPASDWSASDFERDCQYSHRARDAPDRWGGRIRKRPQLVRCHRRRAVSSALLEHRHQPAGHRKHLRR